MKRLVAKLCLFVVPVALLVCVDLSLRVDAFTFRTWEALRVEHRILVDTRLGRLLPYTTLPGPFFPRTRIARVEEGDLGHGTPFAERHAVFWETDEYGYRIRSSRILPELVVVGDSTVVGTGLSQEDTLAEVLRRDAGLQAYPFAPATMSSFLAERRFQERPPRFVVIACIERDILGLGKTAKKPRQVQFVQNELLKTLEIGWVRARRLNILQYLRAQINGRPQPLEYGGVLFRQGLPAFETPKSQKLRAVADTLARYSAEGRDRGFRLAVLVVPNKETVYRNLLPDAPIPTLIPALYGELRQRGIEVLDVEGALQKAWERGLPLYLADDTHWNAAGVRIAATVITDWARRNP